MPIYGSIGVIVMGAGMSLVMTNIGMIIGLANSMAPGIAIGVVYPPHLQVYPEQLRKEVCGCGYCPQRQDLE